MTTSDLVPVSTAHQARCRVFQATRRPVPMVSEEIVTAWGTARVKGRLGQTHADIIEAIMYSAERKRDMPDGRVKLLVDPARVRRIIAGDRERGGGKWLKDMLDEIMQALVELHVPRHGIRITGHIIDEIVEADLSKPDPLHRGQDRHLWRVVLGRAWVQLLEKDIWVSYHPAKIAALRSGIAQAVARHVLTHRAQPPGGWRLDDLLRTVGATGHLRDRRREIVDEARAMRALGIEVDAERVRRVHIHGERVLIPGERVHIHGSAS